MIGFLDKLFKGSKPPADKPESVATDSETFGECTITATPMKEASQWRLAGRISRTVDGETLEKSFIRADLFPSKDEATSFSLRKGRQIVEQTPNLFAPGSGDNV